MPTPPFPPSHRRFPKIEKRPGDDWVVDVLIIAENQVHPVTVFGASDAAAAERDALSSFSYERDELRVVAVHRQAK